LREATLITTSAELETVASRLLQADAVAVDTEFFWERTFYPILGLVQLATRDHACWLVDTVRVPDISALGPVLETSAVTKVLHDAPQDLGILARATGARTQRIFDTRLAAGFANLDSTSSLQNLLKQAMGVDIPKGETRSDWLRRPLTPNQLRYAADDVVHLIPLRDKLLADCSDDEVRAWLHEDLARLDVPATYQDRDPQLMYLRVKGANRLNTRQRAILRDLAAWREMEARRRDWPRGHVMPDETLVSIACAAPADSHALASVPEFPRQMPESVRAGLLAAVNNGTSIPDAACPPSVDGSQSRRTPKPRSDRLLAHIKSICATRRIDPALVASRSEADSYLLHLADGAPTEHPLEQGWRSRFVASFTP
jgi:ribonuclease D